ncbi:transposase [Pedobacter sp. UYEF25]
MEAIENHQLSDELQELYLQNKEWLSDVLFLEDETHIFENLFDKINTLAMHKKRVHEIQPVNKRLTALYKKRQAFKALISQHQHLLKSLIKNQTKTVGLRLLQENAQIIENIKTLFLLERKTLRKDLFDLTEKLINAENKTVLLMT